MIPFSTLLVFSPLLLVNAQMSQSIRDQFEAEIDEAAELMELWQCEDSANSLKEILDKVDNLIEEVNNDLNNLKSTCVAPPEELTEAEVPNAPVFSVEDDDEDQSVESINSAMAEAQISAQVAFDMEEEEEEEDELYVVRIPVPLPLSVPVMFSVIIELLQAYITRASNDGLQQRSTSGVADSVDNFIDLVTNHGCYCRQLGVLDESSPEMNQGQGIDELDRLCHDWIKARSCVVSNCTVSDAAGSLNDQLYSWDSSKLNQDGECTSQQGDDTTKVCLEQICKCDASFAFHLWSYYLEWNDWTENYKQEDDERWELLKLEDEKSDEECDQIRSAYELAKLEANQARRDANFRNQATGDGSNEMLGFGFGNWFKSLEHPEEEISSEDQMRNNLHQCANRLHNKKRLMTMDNDSKIVRLLSQQKIVTTQSHEVYEQLLDMLKQYRDSDSQEEKVEIYQAIENFLQENSEHFSVDGSEINDDLDDFKEALGDKLFN